MGMRWTPEQERERIAEVRARYPRFIISPGDVVRTDDATSRHPGLDHCGSCMADQEGGYVTVYSDGPCCCFDKTDTA